MPKVGDKVMIVVKGPAAVGIVEARIYEVHEKHDGWWAENTAPRSSSIYPRVSAEEGLTWCDATNAEAVRALHAAVALGAFA